MGRLAVLLCALAGFSRLAVADEKDPVVMAVMTSSAGGSLSKTAAAIRAYTAWQVASINAAGGIRGRSVELQYFDDGNDIELTAANVDRALAIENLIGIVGVWSSTRGAAVVERVGASGVPFISEISRQELIAPYPNIFSMARAAAADLPAFETFVTKPERRVAYFGVEGDLFTQQFAETLERLSVAGAAEVTSWEWTPQGQPLSPEYIADSMGRIREDKPDALILAIGSNRGGQLLAALAEAGIETPIYAASGSMIRMLNTIENGTYGGEIFQTRSSVPGVTNSRLGALLQEESFVRVGAEFPPSDRSYGASYADIVQVMADAANVRGGGSSDLSALRKETVRALAETASGTRVYRGATRDWIFDKGGSAVESVYLLRREGGTRRIWLHDEQVSAVEGERRLRRVPIVYTSIDLVQITMIDSAAETFDASFYISTESKDGVDLDDFEFANAVQSDIGARPILAIRKLKNSDGRSGGTLNLYKVDGRFQFDPNLARYPFDRQVFSIQLQPADTAEPFILQPPPERMRDRTFQIPGWQPVAGPQGEFIGADQDLISVVAENGTAPRVIAFQRYSFTWLAQRQSLDYYLRVVLPLALIMVVAYLSVFMPKERFDSAVSLQVTALLSTIALYLAIPKITADTATLSDQTFVFAEAVVVLIISLSILRVNFVNRDMVWMSRVVGVVQIVAFPLLAPVRTAST
ncbi:MAG: ABC transporter substrate-binding protein [Pseudomonadota bacterium]